jgi:hypothetical protein
VGCVQEGEVFIEGADSLEVIFNKRCRLPRRTTLTVMGPDPNKHGRLDMRDEAALLAWRASGAGDPLLWDMRSADLITHHFRCSCMV